MEICQTLHSERRLEHSPPINRLPVALTLKDVQCIVHNALGPTAIVETYSLQSYSEEKLGFLGSHQYLKVSTRKAGSTEAEKLNFFVKTVPYDIPSQAEYIHEKGIFIKEATFFNKLVPLLAHSYQGEPWGPRCYLAKNDSLVFEELGIQGFSMRGKLFNEELATAALAALARMHAASLIAEAHLGKPINQLYPEAFKEICFCHEGKSRQWFLAAIDVVVAVAEQLGLDPSLLPEACEQIFAAVKPSQSQCNVVSHGDAWSNNIMFDNTSPPRCRLVDFQLARYSPPAHDIAQLLHLTTSRRLRDTRMEAMLKSYYTVLCDNLRAVDLNVKPPSWSDIVRGMQEQRLCAAITACVYMPSILLDGAVCAKVLDDSKKYNNFIFEDRRDIVLYYMKNNTEYAARINEAVTDLHELASNIKNLPKPS